MFNLKQIKDRGKWANKKVINSFVDKDNPDNNIILTNSESISIHEGRNILVVGSAGSGKSFHYVQPNIIQKNSSYVINDCRGELFLKYDRWFSENGYKIKKLDICRFENSDCYNPFSYIRIGFIEQDIKRLVEVLIKNTSGLWEQLDDDSVEVCLERLLYTAYIALMFCIYPEEERNFKTLIEMLSNSEVRENDMNFKNTIDWQFEAINKWVNDVKDSGVEIEEQIRICEFAYEQYSAYKAAVENICVATMRAKKREILISCSVRLVSFSNHEMLRITSRDELKLNGIDDEPTVLFIIRNPHDVRRNVITTLLWTQLFDLFMNNYESENHVHLLIDDFQESGYIINFTDFVDFIFSTKRGITLSVCIQTVLQLRVLYEVDLKEFISKFDVILFMGNRHVSCDVGFISELTNVSYNEVREVIGQEKCILVFSNKVEKAFLSDKYDVKKHKRYLEL